MIKSLIQNSGYYFVTSERSHSLARVRKIRSWLQELCADFDSAA